MSMAAKAKPAGKAKSWETAVLKLRWSKSEGMETCPRCGDKTERRKRGHFIVCVSCKQRIEIVGGTLCANCKTPLELTYRARHVGPYVYGPGNRIRRWSAIVHAKNGLESCPGTTAELPKLKRGRPAGLREDLGA